LRQLINRYPYRLDTNFAKMDRIEHAGIEAFKQRVMGTPFHGQTIGEWGRLLSKGTDTEISRTLERRFDIREEDIREILA